MREEPLEELIDLAIMKAAPSPALRIKLSFVIEFSEPECKSVSSAPLVS